MNANETEVEATLGSLPTFLGQLKDRLESALGKVQKGSSTVDEGEDCRIALQDLLAITTEWHQRIQQRDEENLKKRKAWEEKNPIQVAQEHELSLYAQSLQPLLDAPSARAISSNQWQEADKSLASLQLYLLDNKISAEQIRGRGNKGIESLLRDVLGQMEEWDAEGLGFKKDDRVNLELVEKIWGRADKIGSGLNYLLVLDARGELVEGVVSLHETRRYNTILTFYSQKPTTRSVFLLKSAPPAQLSFSSSKDAMLVKKLGESRERLSDIVFDPNKSEIKREDESRWNAAYRELEALEKLLKRETDHISQETIKESKIDEIIGWLCYKLESLHVPPKADEDGSAFALMYGSWELAMRIGRLLGVSTKPGPESEHRTG